MIHLHTLGDALITVGDKEIRPSSPMIFAALLYLGVERGRRVPRAALQEMFFPKSDERSGSHSVRQLLYKLRQLGAPVGGGATWAGLACDVVDSIDDAHLANAQVALLQAGYLPAYQPLVSDAFSQWLQLQRDQAVARICHVLVARMSQAASIGNHNMALALSGALLSHDPLNEEATLVRAKFLVAVGRKEQAVGLLKTYSSEVSSELRLPSDILRKRIQRSPRSADEDPFIGREEELRHLLRSHQRAASGVAQHSILWGEAGIGKSRLAQEFASRVSLDGSRVVWSYCQQHTITRPLGVLLDFVPELLSSPGALGVSPASMHWLRLMESRNFGDSHGEDTITGVSKSIGEALVDLITSIAAESPLLLVVEDAQWIDDASRDFLQRRIPRATQAHVLFTSRTERLGQLYSQSPSAMVCKLAPLSSISSGELLNAALPARHSVDREFLESCITLAAGNPLFLRTVAAHISTAGSIPLLHGTIPSLMQQRLDLLGGPSLLLLRVISVLGNHATVDRLRRYLQQQEFDLLLAIQDLSDHGFVVTHEKMLRGAHQILIDTVIASTPLPLRRALYEKAAEILEAEGTGYREPSLLWGCADFWLKCGNNLRAAKALRECASFAADLGQPQFAWPALERVQGLCEPADLAEVIEETIRLADSASDDSGVLRNYERYKQLRPTSASAPLHFTESASIRAQRRLGQDIWAQRERLLACAQSSVTSLGDRRRAVRTLLATAEESFGGDEVRANLSLIEHLWVNDAQSLDSLELKMLYNLIVGDVRVARDSARLIASRITEYPILSAPWIMNGLARTLFASGEAAESMEASQKDLSMARRTGSILDIAMATARLADNWLTLGDWDQGRYWISETDKVVAGNPYPLAYHLANKTLWALGNGNPSEATACVELLKQQTEARKPHASRSILGYELLICSASDALTNLELDLATLLDLDALGGRHSEHLIFAAGLFLLLRARGQASAANVRWRLYIETNRRELYDWDRAISPLVKPHELFAMRSALTRCDGANQRLRPASVTTI